MVRQIYLDNAATTCVDERVIKVMLPYFSEKYGNPSSAHSFGKESREAIERAREIIAKSINTKSNEIYFTSGGTEANNLALKGPFWHPENMKNKKRNIITTKIEHPSILEPCKFIEHHDAKVHYLGVNSEGLIDIKELENSITPETLLVSIIQGNNEIGTLQEIEKIGKLCKSNGVLFHVDACQSFTNIKLDVVKQNIDLMTLNAHKIHGPKGIGVLFIREGVKVVPMIQGGGHEKNIRSGTENVAGIIGFAEAVKISSLKDAEKISKLRDYTIKKILEIPDTNLNGPNQKNRLCNNINVSFKNIEGEAIGQYLENDGIFVSTGSACASHKLEKSHVLRAIGCSDFEINSSIRISLSKFTTKQDIDYFINRLILVVEKLRKMSPFAN